MNVTFQHVSKLFGSHKVVDDLSLQIEPGEFVVLLGPSGCGKTTTLRMLAGLEDVSSGDIFVGDQRINDVPPQHRDVAMVFQSYALYPHMTVAENIAYPLRVRRLTNSAIKTQVDQVAGLLQIGSLLGRRPRELSGGEKQRVALARAIVRQPRVFLMDEPLSNLDARLRLQMRGELKHLQHGLGTTTVYVTHDQAEAMTLGHRVAVMQAGKLQQFDTPLEIYNRPINRFVAEFVGNPGMNFIDGRIDKTSKSFSSAGLTIPVNEDRQATLTEGPVTLGIRPDHLQVHTREQNGSRRARVYVTELMGNETFVFVELENHRIVVRAPADFPGRVDGMVHVSFDMRKALFFDSISGVRLK